MSPVFECCDLMRLDFCFFLCHTLSLSKICLFQWKRKLRQATVCWLFVLWADYLYLDKVYIRYITWNFHCDQMCNCNMLTFASVHFLFLLFWKSTKVLDNWNCASDLWMGEISNEKAMWKKSVFDEAKMRLEFASINFNTWKW